MARRIATGHGEPLMRLERPSSASSQTTAHIINACFNEILSTQPLDTKDINNLAVSKKLEPATSSEFQEYYVDKLKRISDACSQRLEELSKVERHIMQAKAMALAEDEKNIANLSQLCPSFMNINFPQIQSRMHEFLDEEFLQQHNLLLPSKYLPKPVSHKPPPKRGGYPEYMHTTAASRQHSRGVSENFFLFPATLAVSPRKREKELWKDCLRVPDRLADKHALVQLEKKTAFGKNPKYSENGYGSTASCGHLKQRSLSESRVADSFVVEPAKVIFTDYQPGGTYQSLVHFKNVSAVSRLLKLVPCQSSYFSVSAGTFPTDEGTVAPGMQCSFTVTFVPDSLANYKESLRFLSSNGKYLVVSVQGIRPTPILDIPSMVDCGSCLVGSSKECLFRYGNSGGGGHFKLMTTTDSKHDELSCTKENVPFAVGSFLLSPSEFSVPAGGILDLRVIFSPHLIGKHSEEIFMACNNGRVVTCTITGMAERMHVGCTGIRPSSSAEKLVSCPVPVANKVAAVQTSVSHDQDDALETGVIYAPCVEFPPVCPPDSSFQTIIIRNFSHTSMPFTWEYYQPNTVPLQDGVPLTDVLVESEHCPFTITPGSGSLPPAQATPFVVRFSPDKLGSFVEMGYFTLTGGVKVDALDPSTEETGWVKLSDSLVSVICLQLQGVSHPFHLEMIPPACIIPGKIPIATRVRNRFVIVNHSHSDVCHRWKDYEDDMVRISVSPRHGKLKPGASGCYEVLVTGCRGGPFLSTVLCSVDHSPTDFPFQIRGCVQKPVLDLEPARLDFGLIFFGDSSWLRLCVSNWSNCSVKFRLKQLSQSRTDGYVDCHCLWFEPAGGRLAANRTCYINVECRAVLTGRLKTVVQLLVDNEPHKCVHVMADIQRPDVCLASCRVHVEEAYVGIPCHREVLLRNNSLVPTQYSWSPQVFGGDGDYCKVDVMVTSGQLGPLEEVPVPLAVTWTAQGCFSDALLRCDVMGVESPLLLSLSAQVQGLSVTYQLLDLLKPRESKSVSSQDYDEDIASSKPSHSSLELIVVPIPIAASTGLPLLDFGSEVELGQPISMSIRLTNQSAIPSRLRAHMVNFPAARPPTPPKGDKYLTRKGKRKKFLLGKTPNHRHVIPRNPSKDLVANSLATYLHGGRGACFVVEPSSAVLPAFSCLTLKITAYSNMWGEYTDQLICKVEGLQSKVISVRMTVVGCPISFQATATFGRTLVRFGSHTMGSKPVRRVIKMKNSGPVALRVDWEMFNVLVDDAKIIDLVTCFGDEPFPESKETKSYDDEMKNGKNICAISDTSHVDGTEASAGHKAESVMGADTKSMGDSVRNQISDVGIKTAQVNGRGDRVLEADVEEENVIRVYLKPHEGEEGKSPFSVYPKQLVIPSRGCATMEVCYTSLEDVLQKLGDTPCGYALGHMSIEHEPRQIPKGCLLIGPLGTGKTLLAKAIAGEPQASASSNSKRRSSLAISPLRIEMMAGIEKSQLSLECDDDDGLLFKVPASLLLTKEMKIRTETSEVHHFTLINPSTSIMHFDLSTTSSHFHVCRTQSATRADSIMSTTASVFSISPQESMQFSVKFSFLASDLREDQKHSAFKECHNYEGKLQVKYSSSNVVQEFPLTASVYLPVLSLSRTHDNIGVCRLGSKVTTSFLVSNLSISIALWSASVSDRSVVQVCPQAGVLMPHLSPGQRSVQSILVSFIPRSESLCTCSVLLTEELTQQTCSFNISALGSADEHHVSQPARISR